MSDLTWDEVKDIQERLDSAVLRLRERIATEPADAKLKGLLIDSMECLDDTITKLRAYKSARAKSERVARTGSAV